MNVLHKEGANQAQNNMYKMIALDFDDTLLSDDLSISNENIRAIKEAKDQGVIIMFCSGRSEDSMRKYIDMMDTHDEDEYFISFNGARIDKINGENLYIKAIDQMTMRELVDLGHEYKVTTQLYHDGYLVVENEDELSKIYQKRTGMKVKVVKDIKSLAYSVKVLYHSNKRDLLETIKLEVEKRYGDKVNSFFSKTMYLEVLNPQVNKGLAVKFMANHLGIKHEEVIAVGDGYNDINMIEYAGLGVAVQNSHDDIKASADYVTKATNNESAVAEVIDKFILKDL